MRDDFGPQNCPYSDCDARYVAAVLENRDDWRCLECERPVAPCPMCRKLVSITDVYDRGDCPACRTHRLDLGDAWREKEQEVVDG